MHSKRFKSSKGNSIHNISSLRDMKGQRGLAREQRPHTFNNPNGEDSARTRAEIRERILKEAMSVLGEEEEFRPTTTTFRTKLHSSSNSSADSQTVVRILTNSCFILRPDIIISMNYAIW